VRMVIFIILLVGASSHSTDSAHSIDTMRIEIGREERSHLVTNKCNKEVRHQHQNGSEECVMKSTDVIHPSLEEGHCIGKDDCSEPSHHADMERAESGDIDESSFVETRVASKNLDSDTTNLSAPSSDRYEDVRWNNIPVSLEDQCRKHRPCAEHEYPRNSSVSKEKEHDFTRNDIVSMFGLILLSVIFSIIFTFGFLAVTEAFDPNSKPKDGLNQSTEW